MVNKKLASVFDHIKNVDSVSNVCISCNSLIVSVSDNDEDVNRILCLGQIFGLTVVCNHFDCTNHIIISFNL